MTVGGIVLCGGGSRRMGRPKALLPFGNETMLQRVVRAVGQAVGPVVVVAAEGPPPIGLPIETTVVRDRLPGRGPLEGLAVGLHALAGRCETAFVTACDVPLLLPGFVARMVALAAGYDIAVPHIDGFDHPLSGVYRPAVLPNVESLLAADRRRPADLFDLTSTRRVGAEELRDVDPDLRSLLNVNSPEDYRRALELGRVAAGPDPHGLCPWVNEIDG